VPRNRGANVTLLSSMTLDSQAVMGTGVGGPERCYDEAKRLSSQEEAASELICSASPEVTVTTFCSKL
jgi:hypothetical protein